MDNIYFFDPQSISLTEITGNTIITVRRESEQNETWLELDDDSALAFFDADGQIDSLKIWNDEYYPEAILRELVRTHDLVFGTESMLGLALESGIEKPGAELETFLRNMRETSLLNKW